MNFLRTIERNLILLPDINHRSWNDTPLAFGDSGLLFWVHILVVILCLDTGPWQSQRWWGNLKEGAQTHYETMGKECQLLHSEREHIEEDRSMNDKLFTKATMVEEGQAEEHAQELPKTVAEKMNGLRQGRRPPGLESVASCYVFFASYHCQIVS